MHDIEQRVVGICAQTPPVSEPIPSDGSAAGHVIDGGDEGIGSRTRDHCPCTVWGLTKNLANSTLCSGNATGISMLSSLHDNIIGAAGLYDEPAPVCAWPHPASREAEHRKGIFSSTDTRHCELLIEVEKNDAPRVLEPVQKCSSTDEQLISTKLLVGSLRRHLHHISLGEDREILGKARDTQSQVFHMGSVALAADHRACCAVAWTGQPAVIIFSKRCATIGAHSK